LPLQFLKTALEPSVCSPQILDLELHGTVLCVKVVDKVFERSIPLRHLLDIKFRDRSLPAADVT
jgi:hypothetical protein